MTSKNTDRKGKHEIVLKDVWKIYKMGESEVKALQGIDLEIHGGEFVAIQGPSGSGKSTMVNMVGCLDIPSQGRIFLDSHDISKMTESELAQVRGRKIGFIFQKFNLIPTLTALENVMLPMTFQGMSEDERFGKAKKLLAQVGLQDRMEHKPSELSGGQQQRVAIARALANDPEVILADEPTGNLDSTMGKTIMEFLTKMNSEGKTIIMVTHDDNLAHYAKRIVYIKDGRITSTGNGKHFRVIRSAKQAGFSFPKKGSVRQDKTIKHKKVKL